MRDDCVDLNALPSGDVETGLALRDRLNGRHLGHVSNVVGRDGFRADGASQSSTSFWKRSSKRKKAKRSQGVSESASAVWVEGGGVVVVVGGVCSVGVCVVEGGE